MNIQSHPSGIVAHRGLATYPYFLAKSGPGVFCDLRRAVGSCARHAQRDRLEAYALAFRPVSSAEELVNVRPFLLGIQALEFSLATRQIDLQSTDLRLISQELLRSWSFGTATG
jgi:hypothetical protein